MKLLLLAAALAVFARADVYDIAVNTPGSPASPIPAGSTVQLGWLAALDDADNYNTTRLFVYPYVNGGQWGAESLVLGSIACPPAVPQGFKCVWGLFMLPLPVDATGTVTVAIAVQSPPTGPTIGLPPPPGALVSSPVSFDVPAPAVAKRRIARPEGGPTVTLYFETWFTPRNFYWQGGVETAEAIPLAGRYHSFNPSVMRQQAYWFAHIGVDALGIDWTNNLWNTPTWADRAPNVQEIVNATSLFYGVLGDLATTSGWDVPQQMLILGLDNGPQAPLLAIDQELAFMQSAYINNASLPSSMWLSYQGNPLVTIFDGRGIDHSDITYPNYTIRWMASQDQSSHFNLNGYWSWMDGASNPPVTPYQGTNEAATITPAFFAADGWTAPTASGHMDGLTLLTTFANVVQTVGLKQVGDGAAHVWVPNITHILVSQWQEYAGQQNGQGYGPTNSIYVDAYSAELSNEFEPTGVTACAYRRPGVACGGWGMRYVNLLAMVVDGTRNISLLDTAVVLSITEPALGAYSNYTDAGKTTINLSWAVTGFNSASLLSGGPWAAPVAVPVQVEIDGAVVAQAAGGVTSVSLNISALALDRQYPHTLTLTALSPGPGSTVHLTTYPCALETLDEGVPLAPDAAVPASSSMLLRLPEAAC